MSSRPNVPLEKHKYKISDVILTADDFDEPIIISHKFIRSLSIINDYENTVSPRMQLVCQVDKTVYENIILSMNTLTATLTIYKIFIGEVTDSSDVLSDEALEQDHVWRRMSLKAMNEESISTNNANQLSDDDELKDDSADNSQKTAMLTLLLYDKDKISKYRKSNYFIVNGGKNDALYSFFKDRDFADILLTPTDNENATYIIPYGHLGNNIASLNSYYGIYDNPYLFFMDIDCIYLIDKGNIGNTLRSGELKTVSVYLEKENTTGYISCGSYCDTENNMYILNVTSFNVSDNDSSIDYAVGGNIKTVIGGTGEVKNDKIGNYDVERTVVVDNEKQHTQLIHSIKEQRRNLILQFSNIDISIITPNKRYTILPDESFYNSKYDLKGDYRLNKTLLLFKRNNEDELASSIQVVLSRIS